MGNLLTQVKITCNYPHRILRDRDRNPRKGEGHE